MYLLYVDESGDIGLVNSPSRYFALSGLVVHELRWQAVLDSIIDFRRGLRTRFGLKLREELHAGNFLHKPGQLARIRKDRRLRILRDTLDFQSTLPDVNVMSVLVDKKGKSTAYEVFENAWMVLVQRFHNTIAAKNFLGPQNPQDYGLLVADRTDEPKLRTLTRKMRRYNPVPSRIESEARQILLTTLVEDPVHRDSQHSYFVQLADVNAYFLYQKHEPCGYVRKKGARNYFDRLDPVLCKVASSTDAQGVVRL
jgi:Protein of unknown function (DUF3800)